MIKTDALTKRYGPVAAVDALSLDIPGGSVVAVLGPNGAGKSTLLGLLMGLVKPTSGGGTVLGKNLLTESVEIRRASAVVPDSKALYRGVTAAEFLEFYARFFVDADVKSGLGLLERWGIDPHRRSEQLSSGARTKVLLAAALARRPELIVLDEPCEGLDVEGVEDLWTSLIRRAGSSDGLGVILATNRIEDAERVCDRLVILDRGRLVLDGQLDDLRERWRRLILRLPDGTEDLGPLPGLVMTRNRDGLIEATTSAWDASLQQHLPDGAELLDAFPMALREIYLAVVGHAS